MISVDDVSLNHQKTPLKVDGASVPLSLEKGAGRVIGIAGTAKNTGKTTTMQAVAAYLRGEGHRLFLTSIGYDGEDLDNVTGLPKPKVTVEEGDFVATALPLFETASAKFADLTFTGVKCALGPVYRGIAVSTGRVVTAGPAGTQEVEVILGGAPIDRTVLLDGALSRLAPLSLATHLIIATGAARDENPRRVAREMNSIAAVTALSTWDERGATAVHVPGGLYAAGSETGLPALLATQVVAGRRTSDAKLRVVIDGPVNPEMLLWVLREIKGGPVKAGFVANHPMDLLLSGDHTLWPRVLAEAAEGGHSVAVRRTTTLLGFTVNPYVPRRDPVRGGYIAHVLPAKPFIDAIRAEATTPCTDIVSEGTARLESWLQLISF